MFQLHEDIVKYLKQIDAYKDTIKSKNEELSKKKKESQRKDLKIKKIADEYENLDQLNKSMQTLNIELQSKVLNHSKAVLGELHEFFSCEWYKEVYVKIRGEGGSCV